MRFQQFTATIITVLLGFSVTFGQVQKCQTAPLEGYSGEDCNVLTITAPNAKHVYTFSQDSKTLKQWDFETNAVVREWPIAVTMEYFIDMSDDSRYLRLMGLIDGVWAARLFDTESGKFVTIEKFGVHAMLSEKLAIVEDVSSARRKILLYDVGASKAVATLEKEKASLPSVSADGNMIAWSTEEFELKVYNVSRREIVFESKTPRSDASVSISPDGRFVAMPGKITEISTKREIAIDPFVADRRNHDVLFTADSRKAFATRSGCVTNPRQCGAWAVLEYDLVTGKLKGDYSEKWISISLTPIPAGNFLMQADASGENFYVPHKRGVALVSVSDYTSGKRVLDVFASLGAVGLARNEAKVRDAVHAAQLGVAAAKALADMKPANVILDNGNNTSLHDYDARNELILIGDDAEVGLFSVKDGKFLATYSNQIVRPGISVKVKEVRGFYSLQPGGNVVARRGINKTELYSRTAMIREIPGVSVLKFINHRHTLAFKGDVAGLYDLETDRMLHTFGRAGEDFRYLLTPDRTKIVVLGSNQKAHQVFDVATGNKLLKFDDQFHTITNNYIVRTPWKLDLTDIVTGNPVTPKGWDQSRVMTDFILSGNYLFFFDEKTLMMQSYDMDRLQYVSDSSVKLLHGSGDDQYIVLPDSRKLMFISPGSTKFSSNNTGERASAYTVHLETGEIIPYRYHVPYEVTAKRWDEQRQKLAQAAEARRAADNVGLDPCMHDLKIKPYRGVVLKSSGSLFYVESFDCGTKKYKISKPRKLNGMDWVEVVDLWIMERDYHQIKVGICPQCNGAGTQVNTVTWSNTTVDNYNANVPGGKVVTTKSGSRQESGSCSVCSGNGLVRVP